MNVINETQQVVLEIPIWLLVLVGILVSLAIVATIYKIFSYRKIGIVSKKTDYLVEDLIYKLELLTPSVELLINISEYVDKLKFNIDQKDISIRQYLASNKENVKSKKKVSNK